MVQPDVKSSKDAADKIWERVMREMSANTRDLVLRALKRVDCKQMNEDQVVAWMTDKVKDLKLLTDGVLNELWDKCTSRCDSVAPISVRQLSMTLCARVLLSDDTDGNGILTETEFNSLVQEYINSCERHSASEITRTLFESFEASGRTYVLKFNVKSSWLKVA